MLSVNRHDFSFFFVIWEGVWGLNPHSYRYHLSTLPHVLLGDDLISLETVLLRIGLKWNKVIKSCIIPQEANQVISSRTTYYIPSSSIQEQLIGTRKIAIFRIVDSQLDSY